MASRLSVLVDLMALCSCVFWGSDVPPGKSEPFDVHRFRNMHSLDSVPAPPPPQSIRHAEIPVAHIPVAQALTTAFIVKTVQSSIPGDASSPVLRKSLDSNSRQSLNGSRASLASDPPSRTTFVSHLKRVSVFFSTKPIHLTLCVVYFAGSLYDCSRGITLKL